MTSTYSSPATLTPTQRIGSALETAKATLPDVKNTKLLEAILLEIAVQQLGDDPAFTEQVRTQYEQAAPKPAPKAVRTKDNSRRSPAIPKVSDYMEQLVPIKHIPGYEAGLDVPPDPYLLLEVFGALQLERALKPRSVADLRKAAALVEARNPGTLPKPKGKAKQPDKSSLIAYIVEYVTAGGASEQQAQR